MLPGTRVCSNHGKPTCNSKKAKSSCCGKLWCRGCARAHQLTNCYDCTYRKCKRCAAKVLMFGDNAFRCPIQGCLLKYSCRWCSKSEATEVTVGYCEDHISQYLCPGCHEHYPLDRALGYGYVRIFVLNGACKQKREYCGVCLQRIKALVDSLLYLRIRSKQLLPRNVMDHIVLLALERL